MGTSACIRLPLSCIWLLLGVMLWHLLQLEISYKKAELVLEAMATNDTWNLDSSDNEVDDLSFVAAGAAHLSPCSDGRQCTRSFFQTVCKLFLVIDVEISLHIPPATNMSSTLAVGTLGKLHGEQASHFTRHSVCPPGTFPELRLHWQPRDYFKWHLSEAAFDAMKEKRQLSHSTRKLAKSWILRLLKCELSRSYADDELFWVSTDTSQLGTRVPTIAEVLTWDWFFMVGSNIEVVNDVELTEDQNSDRLKKVRPILNEVQIRCP